jgi:hypothetical protein
MPISIEAARAAKERARLALSDVPGVVGIGLTLRGESYAVKVNLAQPATRELPIGIDGVDIVYEVVGRILPLRPGGSPEERDQ